ncbi:MAG: leucine-rich repeat domain-containing protein [Clostridia bacterium]|nr:leucine-rich repeat domain-containing protein [Clostridia bacterium]
MKLRNSFVKIDTNESQTTITINDGVKTINMIVRQSFKDSWLHTSVRFIIPKSVIAIKSNAFLDFSNTIEELIIPNNVKSIERKAFDTCTGLKKIVIPKSISKICEETFNGCTSLKEVVLSEGLEEIERLAFKDCASLEKVYIPDSVERLNAAIFLGCTGLKEISIPNHIAEKFDVDFIRYDTNAEVVVRNQDNSYNSNLANFGVSSAADANSYNKSNNSSLKSYCGVVRDNLIRKKK